MAGTDQSPNTHSQRGLNSRETESAWAIDHAGVRCRAWHMPGLVTDFRDQAKPLLALRGCHALSGFEIPFIPAPFREPRLPVSKILQDHRQRFLEEMLCMLHGLHDPVLWRGSARERLMPITTYDLRIVNDPRATGRLRFFLLVKAFVPIDRIDDNRPAMDIACRQVVNACQLCRAQAPPSLTLAPFMWIKSAAAVALGDSEVSDETLGLDSGFRSFGEVRRENFLTTLRTETDYQKFCQRLVAGEFFAVPEPWPDAPRDLVPTCNFLAATQERLVLSVRLQPTVRTQMEHAKLIEFHGKHKVPDGEKRSRRVQLALRLLSRVWQDRELYLTAVEVAGESEAAVRALLSTYAGEFAATSSRYEDGDRRDARSPLPAKLSALTDRERDVARFNLRHLEFLPWGGVSPEAVGATHPAGASPQGFPDLHSFVVADELRLPESFLRRDLELNPHLVRLRRLLSISEVAAVWRLPVASRIGQSGFICRLPSPFPQIPVPTMHSPDSVELGNIVYRGSDADIRFRLPLFSKNPKSPALSDYLVSVSGAPGSGKTSLALSILGQLGSGPPPSPPGAEDVIDPPHNSPLSQGLSQGLLSHDIRESAVRDSQVVSVIRCVREVPFLALDLAGHGRFQQLARSQNAGCKVHSLGDKSDSTFLFNPLEMPAHVPVPQHIERLVAMLTASSCASPEMVDLLTTALRQVYSQSMPVAVHLRDPSEHCIQHVTPTFRDVHSLMDAMIMGEDNTHLTVVISDRERRSLANQWSCLRRQLESVFCPVQPVQAWRNVTELLAFPTVVEFRNIESPGLKRLAFSWLLVCLAEAVSELPHPNRHALLVDDVHVLESSESGTAAQGTIWNFALSRILQPFLEGRKGCQVVILLHQSSERLIERLATSRPVYTLQFRPSNTVDTEFLASCLHLNNDQLQFVRESLSPGHVVLLEPTTRHPMIVNTRNARSFDGQS